MFFIGCSRQFAETCIDLCASFRYKNFKLDCFPCSREWAAVPGMILAQNLQPPLMQGEGLGYFEATSKQHCPGSGFWVSGFFSNFDAVCQAAQLILTATTTSTTTTAAAATTATTATTTATDTVGTIATTITTELYLFIPAHGRYHSTNRFRTNERGCHTPRAI